MLDECLERKIVGEKLITLEILGKKVKGVFNKKYWIFVNVQELGYPCNVDVDKSTFERLKIGTKYSMNVPLYENDKIGEFVSPLDFKFE